MKRDVVGSVFEKRLLRDERLTERNRFVRRDERRRNFKKFRFQNPGVLGYGNFVFERRTELLARLEREWETWIRNRKHGTFVNVRERGGRKGALV